SLTPTIIDFTGYQWNVFSTSLQALSVTKTTQTLSTVTATMNKTAICLNVGLNESNEILSSYKIITNPIHDELIINSVKPINSIVIYNSIGKMIGAYADQNTINVSKFSSGTYFIRVNNEFSGKFVKE